MLVLGWRHIFDRPGAQAGEVRLCDLFGFPGVSSQITDT